MTTQNSSHQPRTILVVDDFDDTRLLLRTWLERKGFRVIEAEDGLQAVAVAQKERPDLIIMDLEMPRLDGLTATRRIRKVKELETVPVVAVSAYGADQFREKALAAGCNALCWTGISGRPIQRFGWARLPAPGRKVFTGRAVGRPRAGRQTGKWGLK